MPCISIWLPNLRDVFNKGILREIDNKAGHVTLTTNKYHISFWPARFFKDGQNSYTDGVDFVRGVEGCLVLNRKIDCQYEGDSDPIEYSIDATISNEDINSVYEEFLNYNGINPQDVTLAKGEELYQMGNDELSKKLFHRTKYSFSAELVSGKESSHSRRAFYHQQQSCVSFVFNLIQTAWLKHHPHRPIPFPRPGGWVIFRYTKYVQCAFSSAVVQRSCRKLFDDD
jgi:hypothetical protein